MWLEVLGQQIYDWTVLAVENDQVCLAPQLLLLEGKKV